MLKIKDNVDLKELEKFGFEFVENEGIFGSDNYYTYNNYGKNSIIKINIGEDNNSVYIIGDGTYCCDPDCVDIIFKLTQAGMLELLELEE